MGVPLSFFAALKKYHIGCKTLYFDSFCRGANKNPRFADAASTRSRNPALPSPSLRIDQQSVKAALVRQALVSWT